MRAFLKFIVWVIAFMVFACMSLALYILVDFSSDVAQPPVPKNQLNDITQLNPITVAHIVTPTTSDEIRVAILNSTGPISIGGAKNSQGGQSAFPNSMHIDMTKFNQLVDFKPAQKIITVQSGMRWRELQELVDPYDLSVKIMQSYANFTIGGSLSVNAHGRYIGQGPLIRSVRSFKLMLASGEEKLVTPELAPQLFYGAIGGYGALGVITEVTLQLDDNAKVKRVSQTMPLSAYREYFLNNVRDNQEIVFHNADIFPPDYQTLRSISWQKTTLNPTQPKRLVDHDAAYWWQPKVTEFVADSNFGKKLRQHVLEPIAYQFDVIHWRNYEASYNIRELEPASRREQTYALREYFVPINNFDKFAANMAAIFKKYDVNVINVSVRHALADTGSYLAWAPNEVFSFVVYYRQGTDNESKHTVATWSKEMIDAALSAGGRYYLPYQLHATHEQFHQAYPQAAKLIALKKQLDPNQRFMNQFVAKYLIEQ